jgi:RNA-directed DNA polymerase
MEEIEIEFYNNIILRESGPTSIWFLITRKIRKPNKRKRRMGAVNNIADAALSKRISWHHINWRQANQNVNRLQSRIVKALQEGNKRKVRALQNLLTNSFSAAALAVRRVTENKGKNTPGVDKQTWRTQHQKSEAIQKVRQRQYRAKPLRRIYIPKPKKPEEKRPLSIPCMTDRAKQALHLMALDPIAEHYADLNSYGFRKCRSTTDAMTACQRALCRRYSPEWILEGDIKACFDTISHDWLMKWIPMNKKVLAQWLKAGFIDKEVFYATNIGTPQGGIISPVLANMALDGLELQLRHQFKGRKVNVIRYADDFIITGNSKELLENKIKPAVDKFLVRRGLALSKDKTHIVHISDGFNFLGFNFRKFKGRLCVKPAKDNIIGVHQKIKEIIKFSYTEVPEKMINRLNPIIRGWSNYYRHTKSSKRVFTLLDHHVWKLIWRWSTRRHPNKGKRWVKEKYFKITPNSSWNFYGKTENGKDIVLAKFRQTRIKFHVTIRNGTNPYDLQHVNYIETRRKVQKLKPGHEKQEAWNLWLKQKGKCIICKEEITELTGYHLHHIKRQCDGGSTTEGNLALLHRVCHEQWHQRDYECNTGLSRKVFTRA